MSQVPSNPVPARPARDVSGAIKSSAINLLIGGAVCLYFGLTLIADAPAAAKTREEVERWWAVDNAFFWSLRGLGGLFILTAALSLTGRRVAMLFTAAAEGLFVALMVAMSIAWTLEARVDGTFNAMVILLLVLAIIGIAGVRSSWQLYRAAGAAACYADPPQGDPP